MTVDPRVRELLERMLENGLSPEQACVDTPELLAEVQQRWRQLRQMDGAVDALFPDAEALAPPPPIVPDIPGYAVEELLGRGGMGIVYRARQLRLDRPVALKMLLGGAYAGPDALERFHREARMVAALQHPHIVQVFDSGEFEGWPYLTMEFVDGGTLAARIAGRPQPARQAATLTATLAIAVHALHRCDVVHRDLKPGNILLTREGTPKISDFGLARRFGGEAGITGSGALLGTPSYMAPEQAAGGTGAVGPAADIWSLGVILYELLTGRPPFREDTAAATMRRLLSEEPPPPSRLQTVPRDLETICLRCLHREPARRYPTAAELAADLERFLHHEPIVARRVGRIGRALHWTRRKPAAASLLLLVSLLLLGAAGLLVRDQVLAAEQDARSVQARPKIEQIAQLLRDGADLQQAQRLLDQIPGPLLPDLQQRVLGLQQELALTAHLDAVRLGRTEVADGRFDMAANLGRARAEYARLFQDAGFDVAKSDAAALAARIQGSNVVRRLVAALDDWALCSPECEQRTRMLEVARRADPDPTGWRDRVRDPMVFDAPLKLQTLADEASFAGQSVQILGSLGERMHRAHLDPLPFLRRVQQAFPGDFWVNFMLGDLLWQGHPEEGIRFFQAALATRPRSAIAHLSLGCALAMGNRLAAARDSFLVATQIAPRYANAFTELGRAWQALGDRDRAREALERAVELDPADYRGHLNLGHVLLDGGRVDDAIAALQQAVRIAPQRAANHEWLGRALTAGNRPDEARAEFDAARRLAPDSPAALLAERRFVEALALAAKAVALEPWSAEAHSQFGQCLSRVGRRAEAAAQFRTALDLQPGDDFARAQLRGLLAALGRGDEAVALCEQAIAAQPDRQQAWDGFAELFLYLGRADDYRRVCGQMLERFALLADAHECERVGRACLLLPPNADVLQRATQLIDRALAAEPGTHATGARPFFLFARAIAEYRAGRFDDAVSTLRGEAGSVLPPAPVLLMAMALQRAGNVAAARRLLGMAALGFDWRPVRASDRDAWLHHLLRREAETTIAPELPDWIAGRSEPSTDDDRRILLGALRAAGHDAAATRLYAELLRSSAIPDVVNAAQRYQAVCIAVAASEGTGNDASPLDETGRAQCRAWARQWLADELAVRAREFAGIPPAVLAKAPNPLRLWSCCAELEPMRDPAALERLPAAEREEWRLLWSRLTAMLDAAVSGAAPATPVAPEQPSGR